MKTSITYQCDICNSSYPSEIQARECENQKLPEMPPIGLIFGNTKGFYKDMTFCVAKTERIYGHYLNISLWACRDTGVGDSLGKELCGSQGLERDWKGFEAPLKSHPTFKRMVAYLKKKKIKPLMLKKGKVVNIK